MRPKNGDSHIHFKTWLWRWFQLLNNRIVFEQVNAYGTISVNDLDVFIYYILFILHYILELYIESGFWYIWPGWVFAPCRVGWRGWNPCGHGLAERWTLWPKRGREVNRWILWPKRGRKVHLNWQSSIFFSFKDGVHLGTHGKRALIFMHKYLHSRAQHNR